MAKLAVLDTLGFVFSITEHAGESVNSNGLDLLDEAADGRATRWAPHRKARRTAMVREVRAIVHEKGPEISMEEIAAGLGTSKSVLYRYFGDKKGLQAALGEYTLARTRRYLLEASQAADGAERAVESMMRTYLEIVARSRNVFLFVNRPSGRGPLQSFVEQVESMVVEVLAAEASAVDRSRLRIWAAGAVGLVRAAAEHWADQPAEERIDITQLSDDLTTMLWSGARTLLDPAR